MGSRTLPLDCLACGGVVDWGVFGPDEDDGTVGATCTCDPEDRREAGGLGVLVHWLEQRRDLYEGISATSPDATDYEDGRSDAYGETLRFLLDSTIAFAAFSMSAPDWAGGDIK